MDRPGDTKQVKIDNWGIFFLQRLQHFFNRTDFCDLTLQFEDNVQLKVHRLVLNTCTEYFQVLENSCDMIDDCLIMPMDLQKDVVVPIVNFMYTGQLEFQLSNFDKLYAAAKLMNLTVLTKLLDAQNIQVNPMPKLTAKRPPPGILPVTWDLPGKKVIPKKENVDLPEQLPGRKLPIWKRKNVPNSLIKPKTDGISKTFLGSKKQPPIKKYLDNTPRPTRFEWPEDDSLAEITSSFDDISYGSQPLATGVKTSMTSLSSSVAFEELTVKREESGDAGNLISGKEYLQEQKLRNDYSEQSTSHNNLHIKEEPSESQSKSILKPPVNEEEPATNKKVRFSLEGKENDKKLSKGHNSKKQIIEAKVKLDSTDLTDHTKIISELFKKYPHLVQKNKNIKLKILHKPNSSKETKPAKVEQAEPPATTTSDQKEYTCEACNIPNDYIQLRSYPEYHDHLLEFHPEKVDSKVCNLCGYKSTRHHLVVYHKLVKHDVQPPPQFDFPRCSHCDYIALNGTLLRKHNTQHEETKSIKCEICDASFTSNVTFVKHCHETAHNFECAYCEKKFVLSAYVKAHMANFHKEFVQPQPEETPSTGIKILSDIPVSTVDIIDHQVVNTLTTPSSEAEALVNVASGIAASLGLVVLNDNRQYVLQEGENQEYIIPDMHEQIDNSQQIIVSQPNAIIQSETNNQSTDELVMVLTDHDYSDGNNPIISGNNSNIVVLYSQPVEGCSNTTQYISAAGNIVLNSETGVIEMNGQKLAVANPKQLQTYADTATIQEVTECQEVESIEMIQQELNSQIQKLEEITNKPPKEVTEEVDGRCEPEPMEVDQDDTCFKKPTEPKLVTIPEESENVVAETLSEKDIEKAVKKIDENTPIVIEESSSKKDVEETVIIVEEETESEKLSKDNEVSYKKRKLPDPEPMDVDEIDAKKAKLAENTEEIKDIEAAISESQQSSDSVDFHESLVLEESESEDSTANTQNPKVVVLESDESTTENVSQEKGDPDARNVELSNNPLQDSVEYESCESNTLDDTIAIEKIEEEKEPEVVPDPVDNTISTMECTDGMAGNSKEVPPEPMEKEIKESAKDVPQKNVEAAQSEPSSEVREESVAEVQQKSVEEAQRELDTKAQQESNSEIEQKLNSDLVQEESNPDSLQESNPEKLQESSAEVNQEVSMEIQQESVVETPLLSENKLDVSDELEAQLRTIHEGESGESAPIVESSLAESSKETLLTDLGQNTSLNNEECDSKVQELVSDWCDDENAPQEDLSEEIQDEVEEVPEPTVVAPVKETRPRKSKKTPQTKALLKDWDEEEGSSDEGDSQSGDEQPQEEPVVNPQLNNLIGDWEDD